MRRSCTDAHRRRPGECPWGPITLSSYRRSRCSTQFAHTVQHRSKHADVGSCRWACQV